MSGIKPRPVRSPWESDKHWVEELDSVLWGPRTTPNHMTGYTPFFMVYGAEDVLPCDIIHDSPRVHMYEGREAKLDRQDDLDGLEEERDVAKARSAFHQQQLGDINTGRYGQRLLMSVNSFYTYQRRKRTSSSPNGRIPSL